MNESIALIFKSVRKFNGLQQTEMAAILGVTQGTISKIESGEMRPELALWFKFISLFHVKDPYCFEYGSVELDTLNNIEILKFESPLFPKLAENAPFFSGKKFFVARDIRPIFDYLQKNYPRELKDLLSKYKIAEAHLFYINNHPIPNFLVNEILILFFTMIKESSLEKIGLLFNSSFGYESHPVCLSSFLDSLNYISNQWSWGKYTYLNERSYRVDLGNKEKNALVFLEENFKKYLNYILLLPVLFHLSLQGKLKITIQIEDEKDFWIVHF